MKRHRSMGVTATACVFDLSTSKGVRAAFVYQDGTNFTVIPAVK
jgi:hypothetical protein